ncbi:XoxI protein [Peribacillus butanolivorans]|uniref:XoxI protein n=1 Tax=Peribacillus butanolivorans TaxID=421767 RepID=UPI0036DB8704
MLKRSLLITALGLCILSSTTGASAAETEGLVNSQEKSFTQEPDGTGGSILAKNKVHMNLKTYNPLLTSTYAVAKSSSDKKQDYIYARAKTFNGNGSLIKTNSASSTKADYIGVKTLNGSTYFRNDFAIGTHTFKLKGYKTINGQTKAYW